MEIICIAIAVKEMTAQGSGRSRISQTGDANPWDWRKNLSFDKFFCWKLHENERNLTEIGDRASLAPLPWIRQCKATNAILTRLRIEILGRAPAGKTKKHEICAATFNGYIFIRYFYKKKNKEWEEEAWTAITNHRFSFSEIFRIFR